MTKVRALLNRQHELVIALYSERCGEGSETLYAISASQMIHLDSVNDTFRLHKRYV